MISFIRRHLAVKLFISYLFIVLVGALILVAATRLTVPEAFNRHMGGGLPTNTGMMQGSWWRSKCCLGPFHQFSGQL